jgi:molybdopterin synthase sulfur carrier subunit
MEVTILAFGIAKDILRGATLRIALPDGATVVVLRTILETQYPMLKQLSSFMIAVNNEYAAAHYIIREGDEIAVIPPVSGG